jgi:hypothetical protein
MYLSSIGKEEERRQQHRTGMELSTGNNVMTKLLDLLPENQLTLTRQLVFLSREEHA